VKAEKRGKVRTEKRKNRETFYHLLMNGKTLGGEKEKGERDKRRLTGKKKHQKKMGGGEEKKEKDTRKTGENNKGVRGYRDHSVCKRTQR